MERIPDHPVIQRMERTGYPYSDSIIAHCGLCGRPIYEGDSYAMSYALRHEVCADCMTGDDEPMEVNA